MHYSSPPILLVSRVLKSHTKIGVRVGFPKQEIYSDPVFRVTKFDAAKMGRRCQPAEYYGQSRGNSDSPTIICIFKQPESLRLGDEVPSMLRIKIPKSTNADTGTGYAV